MIHAARRQDLFGLALGFYATVCQVVLVREALGLSGGNELTVGLGLAGWLAGVGAGAIAAARIPMPGRALAGGTLLAPWLAGSALAGLRLYRALLGAPPGGDPPLTSLASILALGLGAGGLTTGFLFTIAARSLAGPGDRPVSRLYGAEAIGALVGGLAFSFLLAGRLSHLACLGIASGALAASAGWGSGAGRAGRIALVALAAGLFGLAAAGSLGAADRSLERRAFALLGQEQAFVGSSDSAYSHMILARSQDQFQLFRDGRFEYAFPDPWERAPLVHLALTQHPAPERVLILGGGPSDRLEAALAHRPEQVTLTYLDSRVHALCRPYWPASTRAALADPRVRVALDDGRRYVSRALAAFDAVIVSAPPPRSSQANRYHTREFFLEVRRALRPGGVLTVLAEGGDNVIAPEAARAAASEIATLRSVFPKIAVVPGIALVIHGAVEPGIVTEDGAVLEARYRARRVSAPYFSARRFRSLLDPGLLRSAEEQLRRYPATINTDARPLVTLAGLGLWERSLGRGPASAPTWTGRLERTAWLWLAAPLAGWLAALLVRRRSARGPDFGSLFAIASTGASGMAAEIIVLHVFQIASGQLYQGLAMLVALFMAGIAAGAFVARRHLASGRRFEAICAEAAVLGFLLLTGPAMALAAGAPAAVSAWSLLAGAVTGAAFPALLARRACRVQGDERGAAAAIEAADHFGAAFGALVTGVIWVPVYGVTATCLLFAALKAASLAGILVAPARP